MNLRNAIFHEYRNPVFLTLIPCLSFFALSSKPSPLPIVFTLTALLVYSRRLFTEPSQRVFTNTAIVAIAIALAGVLARASPALNALSTSGVSILVLSILSLVTSSLTIATVYIDTRLGTHLQGSWQRLTLFPALWASLWFAVSYKSPIGRLTAWSPTEGGGFYQWMVPFTGPAGNDWFVGAWAVVLSQAIGARYIGDDEDDSEALLTSQVSTAPVMQTRRFSDKSNSWLFAALLVALAVPSFFLSKFPLAVVAGPDITPVSVGCVLPPYRRYKHHTLTLDDYIEESKKLTNSAKFLLWPEGAVTFNSEAELSEGLARVREVVTGSFVGVSFEENFGDPKSGRPGSRRKGIAIVSQTSTSPELIYYKQHLVPIAESFSFSHHEESPNITTFLLGPPKGYNKTEWVPQGPPYTRPLPVTASICLDFAFPSLFSELRTKPALILAPARTWDIAIGTSMWQQARQRAEELGTIVLWCDGGDGGVSGIGGGGFQEFMQVGLGSWVKTIGIPYPFDERRTVFASFGDLSLVIFWLLVFGSTAWKHIHFGPFKSWYQLDKARNYIFRVWRKPAIPEGNLIDT
ncbi:hypothetical protein H0H93_014175 [Arthromyces matolae]|nr:hypothetical protein H0H93_014175 [Arthromyces matolae]